ncbi:MAG: KH domain-containing protein [Spirochaetia bacterium]|nr:KH domain-containing protein [Spirochaetia bacterium]
MQILEINAASEKEALKNASEVLQITTDDITVQVFKKGGGGFLGMGSKSPSTYRVFAIKDKTPEEALLKGAVISVTEKMGYDVSIRAIDKNEDGKTYIHMESDQAGYVIGKRGKTLEAIQFIVNLIVQQFTGEPPKILLDIENYRERRANYLTDIAMKIAQAVKKTKKSRLMEPLNPYERRIVHMALQEDGVVETESEGQGIYKRVRIKLKGSESAPNSNHEQFSDNIDEDDEIPHDVENENLPEHYNSYLNNEEPEQNFLPQ